MAQGCMHSTARTFWTAQLAKKNEQLVFAEAAYEDSLVSGKIEEYRFNSGEGTQQTKNRAPRELAIEVERLESEINRILRKLCGGGIVTMNMRRKSYRSGTYGYYR